MKAEENKKKYKEIPSPQSVATPHQKKGDPICFSIGVTFGAKKLDPDENRELGMAPHILNRILAKIFVTT